MRRWLVELQKMTYNYRHAIAELMWWANLEKDKRYQKQAEKSKLFSMCIRMA
ncbi:uncharacterized protein G2W53_041122 [Senna tora]|uniref:Uncharacterized protein n=1 Tax=Senna tora TaxID=362788 RepID=A0A834W122_9FABA|nr:uncharacterized protein G2W53_041122 [Senna tora]